MLEALPATTIEQLGAGLQHEQFAPRQVVFHQGEPGDRFYVVESGGAEVDMDGRLVRTLGPGDGFGEIALLGDEGRTATIRATPEANLRVSVLERPAFLTAVTGYPVSAAAAQDVVGRLRARDASRPEVVDAP